jgi:two-component system alkaline phosphatase synthesis response regulator PhoP
MVCVLIVDDELSVRSTLRHKLEGIGHQVLDASDGREALRIAEGQRPDIAIVDILMPEMDGIEIIKEFKSKDYRFPIIAMHSKGTARSTWYGNIAKMLGADDVLEKPFTASEVETVVSRLIKQGT